MVYLKEMLKAHQLKNNVFVKEEENLFLDHTFF
jgi:hypothetical protein